MFKWLLGRKRLRLETVGFSECGLVRSENQDHIYLDPRGAVFAVADGMGGGMGGGEASAIVCRRLAAAVEGARGFADLMKNAADAISGANTEIREYASERRWRQMGSTIAVIFFDRDGGEGAVIAHVGDSRVYRVRAGALELLTHDHTVAGEMSRRRSLLPSVLSMVNCPKGATRPEILGYLSHVLTRAIGIDDSVMADWRRIDLKPGDTYLVCSDGVYGMVGEDALLDAMGRADIGEASRALQEAVVGGGASDNYSGVLVRIGGNA